MSILKKPGTATAAAVIETITSIGIMISSGSFVLIGSIARSSENSMWIYLHVLYIVQNVAGFGVGAFGIISARLLLSGRKRGLAFTQKWVLGIVVLFVFGILKVIIAMARGMESIITIDPMMMAFWAAYALIPAGIVFYLLKRKSVKDYYDGESD